MPRIAAEALNISQMSLFWTQVSSGSYDVWGGTFATNPLKTKENLGKKWMWCWFSLVFRGLDHRYGSFYALINHQTVCKKLTSVYVHAKTPFALQVKSTSSLSTDRNPTDVFKSAAFKFGNLRIRLRNNFPYQRNSARRNNSAVIRTKVVPNSSQID